MKSLYAEIVKKSHSDNKEMPPNDDTNVMEQNDDTVMKLLDDDKVRKPTNEGINVNSPSDDKTLMSPNDGIVRKLLNHNEVRKSPFDRYEVKCSCESEETTQRRYGKKITKRCQSSDSEADQR